MLIILLVLASYACGIFIRHVLVLQVVITKCYHLFCNPCVQRIIEARNRKCPVCSASFGPNDVKPVYIWKVQGNCAICCSFIALTPASFGGMWQIPAFGTLRLICIVYLRDKYIDLNWWKFLPTLIRPAQNHRRFGVCGYWFSSSLLNPVYFWCLSPYLI